MRTLKLTLAYDGTRFVGWQRQATGESVQALIEDAFARFGGEHVPAHGAGRTDAGVHALGQVASIRTCIGHDGGAVLRGLNAALPPEIRVLAVEDVDPAFHARFSAVSKTYRYLLCTTPVADPFNRAYAWHIPQRLDVPAMQEAGGRLVGTHDFSAFRSVGSAVTDGVRTISRSMVMPSDVSLAASGAVRCGILAYEVTGTGFLRHMVRAVVGTLVEVGRGWRTPESVAALLADGTRAQAGRTAPPHGLFLVRVDYDEPLDR